MSDAEQYEQLLYRKMRFAIIGDNGRGFFPLDLLMDWEKTRLRINPKAKPMDLLQYEHVNVSGGSVEL